MIEVLFQTFADRLSAATTGPQLRDAMAAVAAALGFDGFVYFRPAEPPTPLLSAGAAAPPRRVGQAANDGTDRLRWRCRSSAAPFAWSADDGAPASASPDALRYGYTVPIWSAGGPIARLDLAACDPQRGATRAVHDHEPVLRLMGLLFHAHVERTLRPDPGPEQGRDGAARRPGGGRGGNAPLVAWGAVGGDRDPPLH